MLEALHYLLSVSQPQRGKLWMFSFLLKRKKKHLSLEGLVMVYLYKCPICAFREMDRDKRCGSGDFISTAFLSLSPLTETMSLNMPHVHLPEGDGRPAS